MKRAFGSEFPSGSLEPERQRPPPGGSQALLQRVENGLARAGAASENSHPSRDAHGLEDGETDLGRSSAERTYKFRSSSWRSGSR